MRYRLHVPLTPPVRGGAPLLVALHGCTQNAVDFAAGTRFDDVANRVGAYVLYPQQSTKNNPRRCWNWFLPENQVASGEEPAEILQLVDDVAREHAIDRDRIFVCGMSAGGAMAAILAEQAPDVFAGAGIVAGVPTHAAYDEASALRQMKHPTPATIDSDLIAKLRFAPARFRRMRVQVWAGDGDRLVHPDNAVAVAEQFRVLMRLARPALRTADSRGIITRWFDDRGDVRLELRIVERLGHRWSGGSMRGSHTQASGPDMSGIMLPFFLAGGQEQREPEFGT